MKDKENENTNACSPFLVDCCQLSMVSFFHLILTIAWVITTSRWARRRKLDHSKKEGDRKPCFSGTELACRQLLLGANAAVTQCLRRVFLRSGSIKLASTDVSDSISLSQAVHKFLVLSTSCVQVEFFFFFFVLSLLFLQFFFLLCYAINLTWERERERERKRDRETEREREKERKRERERERDQRRCSALVRKCFQKTMMTWHGTFWKLCQNRETDTQTCSPCQFSLLAKRWKKNLL